MTAATAPATSYVAPRSIEEAVAAVATPGAALLGGGTVLMALRAAGEVDPSGLVDLCGIEELGRVTATPDRILIGSTVTYASLLRTTDPVVPLLPCVCRTITGGPQIRVQGTLGGSACYANPASDVPAALVALGTSMLVDGPSGRRKVPAAEFFRGPFRTDLRTGELLSGMAITRGAPARWGYIKLKASESSWPIITAAARLEMTGTDGTAVVTISGAAGVPVTVTIPLSSGQHRVRPEDRQLIDDQLGTIKTWWEDALADSRYRRRVAATVATRAIEAALAEDGT